jgi:hypothetical protein
MNLERDDLGLMERELMEQTEKQAVIQLVASHGSQGRTVGGSAKERGSWRGQITTR